MPEVKEVVKIECSLENAPRFWYWVKNRGGIAHWKSIDLSDLDKTMSTPVRDKAGNSFPKPHWKMDSMPAFTCADPDMIFVVTRKEVKRFRVSVRRGSQGLSLKLTDASSSRLRRTIDDINSRRTEKDATYYFDYDMQEAVFEVPDKTITLTEWVAEYPELAEKACAGDPHTLGYTP